MFRQRVALPRWVLLLQAAALAALALLAFRPAPSPAVPERLPMVAKRLYVESPNDVLINFYELRTRLRERVARSADRVGLYFEYLPTGVSISIGGNDEFFHASLVKVPVVMRAYRLLEKGSLSLDEVLEVAPGQVDSDFGDLWKRGAGARLSIREVIPKILQDSDNTAFRVLYDRVNRQIGGEHPTGETAFDEVYDCLDVPRRSPGPTQALSPKGFSSILKSLYFAAYLTFEHSDEVLRLLSSPKAVPWIRSGVREGVPVAGKFGVYRMDPPSFHVHSECGIVYLPQRPYLLCVMVHTADANAASAVIRDVSRATFEFVERAPS